MSVLQHREPRRVWEYFEKICSIPHGSGNTTAIADFCVEFAKARSLAYYRDENNNVVIFKDAAVGYEDAPTIILQGHLDMVCAKAPDAHLDMETDGLTLAVDGDRLYASGTSLGGDNGIAVAMMLGILDDSTLPHPALEAVFTSDEEIGLIGAAALDTSVLKGRRMLNLDSEEEGIFTVSCAGGMRLEGILPLTRTDADGLLCTLSVSGLMGGHSGVEIHKKRGNACRLLCQALADLCAQYPIRLVSLQGGTVDNAIPTAATATVLIAQSDQDGIQNKLSLCEAAFRQMYTEDAAITVQLTSDAILSASALSTCDTEKLAAFLANLPCGVQAMSPDIEGLPQTSLNFGILRTDDNECHAVFSLRSSLEAEKNALRDQLTTQFRDFGGNAVGSAEYPGWAYRKDSPLRDLTVDSYRRLFGSEPQVVAIHAGLECGVFAGKLDGLDCISFGPNMWDIHTAKEQLSISSSERTYQLVLDILKNSR